MNVNFIKNRNFKKILHQIIIKYIYKNQINIYGNKKIINNRGLIIICNHYNISDVNIICSLFNYMPYTVAKDDLLNEIINNKSASNILKKHIFKWCDFIAYKRKDKEDGIKVKKKILELINSKNNVLIFPEGTSTRNGIPKDFKNGIFKLASENRIPILPITIKYEKNIGLNIEDSFKFKNLLHNNVNVYIHDIILDSNWKNLKEKSFNKIVNFK